MAKAKYKRVLLKLSGEVLTGSSSQPVDQAVLSRLVSEFKSITALDVELAVVIGGGNICRGANWQALGLDRVSADQIGMLATVMNAMILRDALLQQSEPVQMFSAVPMLPIASGFQRQLAIDALQSKHVVILSAGTGNPLVTTDSAASLRGIELNCDIVLKATHVDGVYSEDPAINPDATLYDSLTFTEAMDRNLKVMDLTAFQQCQLHAMPIRVFNIEKPGALYSVITGGDEGTLIKH